MANWITPNGSTTRLTESILQQAHTLIAGTTGSGKSVLVQGLIRSIMFRFPQDSPGGAEMILIDPKRVELSQFRPLPHTILYASEPEAMYQALVSAARLVDLRFQDMQARGERLYTGSDIYVIIDELADLLTTDRRRVLPLLQRIGQIGRASKVHLICCTQCPKAEILSTQLKVNFDSILALRTRSAQDSRNIIGINGAENLPRYGKAIYQCLDDIAPVYVNIPLYNDLQTLVDWWLVQIRKNADSRKPARLIKNRLLPRLLGFASVASLFLYLIQ